MHDVPRGSSVGRLPRGSGAGLGLALLLALLPMAVSSAKAAALSLETATIADLQQAMEQGALTSERLVQLYLARIEAYDKKGPALNTVITLNARALETARELDRERREKGPRSALHGIPVMAKDVFDTADMPTTGGFKPMATSQPVTDSFVIARLRKAGAIILAKLNQSDWYGTAPTGGSTLGGQVLSPYNPRKFPGGSSSGTGSAMAAWLGTVGLGSDTGGSIVIPSALNNVVGISSSHGLVSRTGMMWSSPFQENGGPMGRSVYDCAAVLDVIAGFDPADLVTLASLGRIPDQPYTSFVTTNGLAGARLGVLREMFRQGPNHEEALALMDGALKDMKAAGAILVDPVLTGMNLIESQVDAGSATFERAFAINHYLSRLGPNAPIRTVEEMIAKGGSLVKPTILEASKIESLDHHKPLFAAIRHKEVLRSALVDLMEKYRLDAIILPFRTFITEDIPVGTNRPADIRNNLSSYTGLPTVVVPGGFFPSDGMPFAVQFLGRPFSEPTLIKVASGYEAKTGHRKAPGSTPALPGEVLTVATAALARPVSAIGPVPKVALFTTGGTIQSRGTHRQKLSEYSDSRVTPEELLADLPELKELATVEVTEISNHGSGNMTTELLLKLAKGLNQTLARPDVTGAVVTHGTGTLEETAYFLQLTVRSDKPVVVVGAMRPWSAISRDGPLNLYNAVRTAITPEAVGKGVLVLLDDTIHSARFVTKGNTTRVETFVSREIGPLGYADADEVVFYRAPLTRHTARSEFDVSQLTDLPAVNVVYGHQEASPAPLESLVLAGAAGVVLADGSPAVTRAVLGAVARGVAVVQSDRKGSGRVLLSDRQAGRGVVTADSLNPQKARMLLRLALTKTKEPKELQRIFNEY